MRAQADAVLRIYQESLGRSRREIEGRIRELESKVDKYKVVRGLALLVERRGTFTRREGPEPAVLRRHLFDVTKGGAITPEERDRVLARVAPEFGLPPRALTEQLWSDLEEEEVLRSLPALDPGDLLRRFNLGQCQTLLFRATQMSLSFRTPEAYRLAVTRIKRQGLMFTSEPNPEGGGPFLRIEGVVSFLRSTERYGTRLAQLLPELLTLPGWALVSKVHYRDSFGKKRHLDFRLDEGMAEYLAVRAEEPPTEPVPVALEELARNAERQGVAVERSPSPVAVGGGLEYPDLVLTRGGASVYVEAVGYWSPAWLERKLQRTERTPAPYLVVAPKDLAVAAMLRHPRLIVPRAVGLSFADIQPYLPRGDTSEELPRKDLLPGSLVLPKGSVIRWEEVARSNRIPTSQARELLEERGFLCAAGTALDRKVFAEVRGEVRTALPEYPPVERVLQKWGLPPEFLPTLGFRLKWKGLEPVSVTEK
jgi:hypothetical protein